MIDLPLEPSYRVLAKAHWAMRLARRMSDVQGARVLVLEPMPGRLEGAHGALASLGERLVIRDDHADMDVRIEGASLRDLLVAADIRPWSAT